MKDRIDIKKIRRARISSGLSMAQAANKAGVSYPTWIEMEHGKRMPRPENLVKMCKVIGCDAGEVLLAVK